MNKLVITDLNYLTDKNLFGEIKNLNHEVCQSFDVSDGFLKSFHNVCTMNVSPCSSQLVGPVDKLTEFQLINVCIIESKQYAVIEHSKLEMIEYDNTGRGYVKFLQTEKARDFLLLGKLHSKHLYVYNYTYRNKIQGLMFDDGDAVFNQIDQDRKKDMEEARERRPKVQGGN